jgi:hypothetical protein
MIKISVKVKYDKYLETEGVYRMVEPLGHVSQ